MNRNEKMTPANKHDFSRREFLGVSAGAAAFTLLAGSQFATGQATWNQGQLTHLIPTASHERFLIKASFKVPLPGTPPPRGSGWVCQKSALPQSRHCLIN